jgi:type IV secretory pathway VirB10-like protein
MRFAHFRCTLSYMRSQKALLTILLSLFALSGVAQAQSFRYIDSSGNIHFVDSWAQVPAQYRQQIYPPTPTPVYDENTKRMMERERERQRLEKQREMERKKQEMERLREMQLRSAAAQAARNPQVPQRAIANPGLVPSNGGVPNRGATSAMEEIR